MLTKADFVVPPEPQEPREGYMVATCLPMCCCYVIADEYVRSSLEFSYNFTEAIDCQGLWMFMRPSHAVISTNVRPIVPRRKVLKRVRLQPSCSFAEAKQEYNQIYNHVDLTFRVSLRRILNASRAHAIAMRSGCATLNPVGMDQQWGFKLIYRTFKKSERPIEQFI